MLGIVAIAACSLSHPSQTPADPPIANQQLHKHHQAIILDLCYACSKYHHCSQPKMP